MRRTTRASPRSPSRSAATASAAIARPTRPTSGWCRPTASTSPISRGWRKRRCWRATSSTRRRTTWGRRSWRRPRRRWPTRFGASFSCIVGDDLPRQNFPLIHAVGMASPRAPRLIDLSWGDPAHPKVTLVGKGVCFDTGGLDLKPSSGMLIMKKDMGGAANVLALAQMVMDAKLKVRLRVLIPAVENAVAGNAFRPLDIFTVAQGPDRRDRQHRRRGPAGAGRCAGAGRRGEARSADRSRHPDRRGAGGAGTGFAALLHQ